MECDILLCNGCSLLRGIKQTAYASYNIAAAVTKTLFLIEIKSDMKLIIQLMKRHLEQFPDYIQMLNFYS